MKTKFLQEQKSKNTQHKTKSDLNAKKKFCESLKESRAILKTHLFHELDLPLPQFFISVINKMALSTSQVLLAASSEVFNTTFLLDYITVSYTHLRAHETSLSRMPSSA